MATKILVNVFAGTPPLAKLSSPLEFGIEEIEVVRDALRVLRDTRANWKAGHRQSAMAKMAILSTVYVDHAADAAGR